MRRDRRTRRTNAFARAARPVDMWATAVQFPTYPRAQQQREYKSFNLPNDSPHPRRFRWHVRDAAGAYAVARRRMSGGPQTRCSADARVGLGRGQSAPGHAHHARGSQPPRGSGPSGAPVHRRCAGPSVGCRYLLHFAHGQPLVRHRAPLPKGREDPTVSRLSRVAQLRGSDPSHRSSANLKNDHFANGNGDYFALESATRSLPPMSSPPRRWPLQSSTPASSGCGSTERPARSVPTSPPWPPWVPGRTQSAMSRRI